MLYSYPSGIVGYLYNMIQHTDYSKLSDKQLKAIVYAETGGIPLAAVKEHQHRFPEQYTYNEEDYQRAVNSIPKRKLR